MEPSSSVEPTNLQVNFYSQLLSRIQALSGGKAGLFALALATIGLYGTMAYSITRKTHENRHSYGLGAKPADVLGMVIPQGITLTLIGIAIGVLAALGATRFIASMIYGVTPYDRLTFVAVAAILSMVALAACYIPARRAMRVDPMVALRYVPKSFVRWGAVTRPSRWNQKRSKYVSN